MNASLSFRKETIQRSSSASESLSRAMIGQSMRPAHEQRPISITVISTLTVTQP